MEHAPGITVRALRPTSKRQLTPVEWEVTLDGSVIGRVEARKIGHASAVFYFAFGMHPVDGREIRLEGSTDFAERVNVLRRFHIDPSEFSQHLGEGSWKQV